MIFCEYAIICNADNNISLNIIHCHTVALLVINSFNILNTDQIKRRNITIQRLLLTRFSCL